MEHRNSCTRVRIAKMSQETRYSTKFMVLVEWEYHDGSKDTEMIDIPLFNSQKEMAKLNELNAFLSTWKCTTNSVNERIYENTK